ncbi:transposase domain-containing protein [Yoonia sp. MH D7]
MLIINTVVDRSSNAAIDVITLNATCCDFDSAAALFGSKIDYTRACIASLIETCILNSVEQYAYLKATVEAAAAVHPAARIDKLIPWHFDSQD